MASLLLRDWHSAWLAIASFLAGALNAVAGGGSFFSFPAVLATGVLPIQANATNTVALWPGQFTSIAAYRDDLLHNRRMVAPMAAASLLGGLVGAIVLMRTKQATFLALVPWLLLLAAVLFAVSGPVSRMLTRRLSTSDQANSANDGSRKIWLFFGTLVVCFYIGYFGAGAGFLIITLLAISGIEDLNHINALKVVSTTLANGIAVVTFIVRGQVVWQHCIVMMITAAAGGYLGAHSARKVDQQWMRRLVVAIGLSMSAYFFWKQMR